MIMKDLCLSKDVLNHLMAEIRTINKIGTWPIKISCLAPNSLKQRIQESQHQHTSTIKTSQHSKCVKVPNILIVA